MAAVTYTVKRGDSLWKICSSSEWGPKISGNNIWAKIATLRSLNNIPENSSLILIGQVLTLSGSGGSSGSSSTTPSNKVVINALSLNAESNTGRDVVVYWTWTRDKTKGYKIRWEWDRVIDGKSQTESEVSETSTPGIRSAEFTVPEKDRPYNNWVQVFITPLAETYREKDASGNEVEKPHWTGEAVGKQYHFKDNPPSMPDTPTCEIEDTTLTMKIESVNKKIDAANIVFQVVKDNTSVVYTSSPIPVVAVTDDYGKVSHQYTVALGSNYKARAKSVASNGKESGWTEFSEEAETKPAAPSSITTYRGGKYVDANVTKYSVYLEWTAVSSANKYLIEYTTDLSNFDNPTGSVQSVTTNDNKTSITILDLAPGSTYFFRVRALTKTELKSDHCEPVEIPIGEPPGPPTTWSSADSVFVGDDMELNWIHNSSDGSIQTKAEISLKIGDMSWISYEYINSTTAESVDPVEDRNWTYGVGVSYKGALYFKLNTTQTFVKNQKVQWKVRTAGVTEKLSDSPWSTERTIWVYEKPTFELTMTKDQNGTTGLIEKLDSLPFYIIGKATFDNSNPDAQKVIGYHVRIVSDEFYTTVDEDGSTKTVNSGDVVYDRYIDTADNLNIELSANDVDFEPGIPYILYCTLNTSTGLTLTGMHTFNVSWSEDTSYRIVSDVLIDKNSYTATINPYCVDIETGKFTENITLSVYRREYNGSYTKIASGIPNTNTSVTDPHPALDYARYRIVAKNTTTGSISFYDAPGEPVNVKYIIIQWNEEWNTFDVSDQHSVEGPAWSGSLLELKYNVEVSDNRSREVSMVNYAGRENPVSYYGTHITETPSWKVSIPKDDKETIYALRKLSMYSGDVYIREPSGMGYWANVTVSFPQTFKEVTTSVSLNITKVEGGV